MKIIFPELENPVVMEAANAFPNVEPVLAHSLNEAGEMLKNGLGDSIIAGLDYTTREVLLSFKNSAPLVSSYFSSCFICKKGNYVLAVADGGVIKNPSRDQLYTIVEDTAKTFKAYTGQPPRIAMLSYSTKGSGGEDDDPDIEKINYVITKIRQNYPDYLIDGEMQLDAAINPVVGGKKFPGSPVAGQANILITVDLNSGNILYKALEQFAGFTVAGPIVQGFKMPLADLSRGSTVEDVKLTIDVVAKQLGREI